MQVSKDFSVPSPTQSPVSPRRPSFVGRHKLFFGTLAVFLGLILLALTLVAKTGLVRIPLVSSIVRTTSDPVRAVLVPPGTQSVNATRGFQLEGAINRYARSRSDEDRAFEIRFSEASLTKTLQEAAPDIEAKFSGVKFLEGQVAVDDVIEFYLRIERDGRPQTLRARFGFRLEQGMPKLLIEEVRIGSLSIPNFLVRTLVGRTLEDNVKTMMQQNAVEITGIEMRKGLLIISLRLPTNVTNLR